MGEGEQHVCIQGMWVQYTTALNILSSNQVATKES